MEKEQKLSDKEMRELTRKYSLETLGHQSLWMYALPKLVTKEQYGDMAQFVQENYQQFIQKAPDQKSYELLFAPLRESEDGTVSNPLIQKTAALNLKHSIMGLYVQEVLSDVGSDKKVKGEYGGKFVGELSEKERQVVVEMYMQDLIRRQVSKVLSKPSGEIAGGLEQILSGTKPEKKNSMPVDFEPEELKQAA
ncbi:hypothetical protein KAJ87_00860 [Candidatus Pacearchaeota archaeon]|nr:hypothetical protein [Candidatus Pacearchaeota archaeon]